MKGISKKILRVQNLIITGILFMMGFIASCVRMEYGMPHADFIVTGKIKSAETNQEIRNIEVKIHGNTVKSDEYGNYEISVLGMSADNQTFDISYTDIDGTENGEYQNLDTLVQFDNPEFTGGDGDWYEGETTTEFDIKLESKE